MAIVWGASTTWVSTPYGSVCQSIYRNCDLCVDLHEETIGMDLGSTYLKPLHTKPIETLGITSYDVLQIGIL